MRAIHDAITPTSEPNPCLSCGACCAFSSEWPRFTTETDAEIQAIPAAFVDGRGMHCRGDRCSALDGDVGLNTSCAVHDVRPEVCRSCAVGDPECTTARAKFALPPLAGV